MKPLDKSQLASSAPCAPPGDVHAGFDDAALSGFLLLDPAELDAQDNARWDRLGEAAATANVYAAPWFLRISLSHCRGNGTPRLAVVTNSAGEWIGMLPVTPLSHYGRIPFPHWAAWHHANMFDGTPLVRPGLAGLFWKSLLAGLTRQANFRGALRLHGMPMDDETNTALIGLASEAGYAMKADCRYARASLGSARSQIAPDHRRRIAGLWRKLEREQGAAQIVVHRDPKTISPAVDAFLRLEKSGWKGAAGSALECGTDTGTFFAEVCHEGARRGTFEMAELSLGGQPLAFLTYFLHRGHGDGFKMAYDESFARYSPGLLLLDRMTDSFVDMQLAGFDSCCLPGQQPIERLWHERREMIDCGIAPGGTFAGLGLQLLDFLDKVRRPKPA